MEKIIDELLELTEGCLSGKYDKVEGKEKLNEILKNLSNGDS